jgi:hypothetical protein
MYLPSNTPILADQREAGLCRLRKADAKVQAMRLTSATGRAQLFNTLINPNGLSETLGTGAGLDAAKLQQQTENSRASAILGGESPAWTAAASGGNGGAGSVAEIIRNAPEVVSLNRGGGCQVQAPVYKPSPVQPDPQPGMPQRAVNIVTTPMGPLNFQGQPSTLPSSYPQMQPYAVSSRAASQAESLPIKQYYSILSGPQGLTGYAPPWSDAGVQANGGVQDDSGVGVGQWLMDHPWLALLLASGGVYALSRRKGR